MALARVHGAVVDGVTGVVVLVEVDVAQGLPSIGLVGLAGETVAEARWRVRSAIGNSRQPWPAGRVTIGLSPADIPKDGTGLDLAIAVGILQALDRVPASGPQVCFIGELGLDGTVHPVAGALAAGLAAWRAGLRVLYVSAADAGLLALLPDVDVRVAGSLGDLVAVLSGEAEPARAASVGAPAPAGADGVDLSDVQGHGGEVLLGLRVAAAGGHHCSLIGPPGVGKSMIARRLVTVLPDLDDDQAVEVTALYGLTEAGATGLMRRPPFVAPHHSASAAAVLGTARAARLVPGAITLAHHGLLLLDEAPEFSRPCLEGLRQPMESGFIAVHRVGRRSRLPARFQLALTANPCPCGHFSGTGVDCSCPSLVRRRYAERLSAPVMDRVDVRLAVPRPDVTSLTALPPSSVVRGEVEVARDRAAMRFRAERWQRNCDIPGVALRGTWAPDERAVALLEATAEAGASMRGLDRVLRMAWSLADLAGRSRPVAEDVATALSLRGQEAG